MEPLDLIPFAGMIMSLLLALIIGGFILMYPLTKRLGQLLEQRLHERREGVTLDSGEAADLAQLRRAVRVLEEEVATLTERQRFVEGLLDSPERRKSIAGGSQEP